MVFLSTVQNLIKALPNYPRPMLLLTFFAEFVMTCYDAIYLKKSKPFIGLFIANNLRENACRFV